jgi:hypothetical protein
MRRVCRPDGDAPELTFDSIEIGGHQTF